jgi:hypothetical protein
MSAIWRALVPEPRVAIQVGSGSKLQIRNQTKYIASSAGSPCVVYRMSRPQVSQTDRRTVNVHGRKKLMEVADCAALSEGLRFKFQILGFTDERRHYPSCMIILGIALLVLRYSA